MIYRYTDHILGNITILASFQTLRFFPFFCVNYGPFWCIASLWDVKGTFEEKELNVKNALKHPVFGV